MAGIVDWKAAGLPLEGTDQTRRVADATRTGLPTASTEEALSTARHRTREAGWDLCVVVGCGDVVAGLLAGEVWDADGDQPVYEVMEPGPTTVRPSAHLDKTVERMRRKESEQLLVTTPDGGLIGVIFVADGERVLAGEPLHHYWADCDGCPGQWGTR